MALAFWRAWRARARRERSRSIARVLAGRRAWQAHPLHPLPSVYAPSHAPSHIATHRRPPPSHPALQLEQLRAELLAASARVEQAGSAAVSADENAARLVSALAQRVDQLAGRVDAAESRARTAEAAAADAAAIARSALDEAASLRSALESRDRVAADDREGWDARFASLLSQARRWHEDANAGLAGSQAAISGLASSVDRVTAEAARLGAATNELAGACVRACVQRALAAGGGGGVAGLAARGGGAS